MLLLGIRDHGIYFMLAHHLSELLKHAIALDLTKLHQTGILDRNHEILKTLPSTAWGCSKQFVKTRKSAKKNITWA